MLILLISLANPKFLTHRVPAIHVPSMLIDKFFDKGNNLSPVGTGLYSKCEVSRSAIHYKLVLIICFHANIITSLLLSIYSSREIVTQMLIVQVTFNVFNAMLPKLFQAVRMQAQVVGTIATI